MRNLFADGGQIRFSFRVNQQVSNQPVVTGTILSQDRCRLTHAVLTRQSRIDFTQLDAMTVQLDLIVHSAQMIDLSVRHDGRQITRSINGNPVPIDENFLIQFRTIQIAERYSVACNQQLARCLGGTKLVIFINDVDLSVCERKSDQNRRIVVQSLFGG